jgi:hypothetical protein
MDSQTYLSAEERRLVSAIVIDEEPEKKERLNTKVENRTSIDRNISCVRGTFVAMAEERELIECQQERTYQTSCGSHDRDREVRYVDCLETQLACFFL